MWKSYRAPRNSFYKDNAEAQTNTTQAQVNTNQTQVENSLIAYNDNLASKYYSSAGGGNTTASPTDHTQIVSRINADEGTATSNLDSHIPPPNPTTAAVIGPTELQALAGGSQPILWASAAQEAIDPNITGLISTFNQSADTTRSDLTSGETNQAAQIAASQGALNDAVNKTVTASAAANGNASPVNTANGTQLALGPQYSSADVDPTTTSASAPSGGGGLLPLIGLGIVGVGAFFLIKSEHKKAE